MQHVNHRGSDRIRELEAENRRLRDELALIVAADPLDLMLDPQWPQRIARAALSIREGAEAS